MNWDEGVPAPGFGEMSAGELLLDRLREAAYPEGGRIFRIEESQDLALARHKGGKMGPESITKMDSAMAAQNIMLAAHELGLGTCVIASFHPGAVAKILGMPEHILPHLLVSVGHPNVDPPPPERLFEDIYWFESYHG